MYFKYYNTLHNLDPWIQSALLKKIVSGALRLYPSESAFRDFYSDGPYVQKIVADYCEFWELNIEKVE